MFSRVSVGLIFTAALSGCFGSGQSVQIVGPAPASSSSLSTGSGPNKLPAPTGYPSPTPSPTPPVGVLSATPSSISFGSVIIGQGANSQTFSLSNSASETAEFISNPGVINLSQGCGSLVSISADIAPSPACTDQLDSNSSCNLTLTYSPTQVAALSNCVVSIYYRYASSSNVSRQLDIAVSGAGLAAAAQPLNANDSSRQWDISKMNAPQAWGTRTDCSTVPVAVIDTGVDTTLQDLRANIDLNHIFGAMNGTFTLGEAAVKDDNGHGTHVSGTIAAIGNNGTDITGICWKAKLMAYKTMNAQGAGTANNTLNAIKRAVTDGAKVINLSLGGWQTVSSTKNGITTSTGIKEAYASVISDALSKGTFLVFAAGNDSENIDAPKNQSCSDGSGGTATCQVMDLPSGLGSSYANTIAVGSTDPNDNMSCFSNYGATGVEISAPGSSILSLRSSAIDGSQSGIAGICPSGTTCVLNGTSMAAPHVAGALALLWAQIPSLKVTELKQRLIDRAKTVSTIACGSGGTTCRNSNGNTVRLCMKGGKRLSLETLLNP